MRGRFITLEGVEGSGKTTNLEYLCETLKEKNVSFIKTREPGGTELAEAIREAMLAKWQEEITGLTEVAPGSNGLLGVQADTIKEIVPSAIARFMGSCFIENYSDWNNQKSKKVQQTKNSTTQVLILDLSLMHQSW